MTSPGLSEALRPELDEALLALSELCFENPEEALSMFDSLPEPVQALPEFQLALARAHQATGQLEAARDLAGSVVDVEDHAADAHHLLADVLEDLGQLEDANEHFKRTLDLDRAAFEESEVDRETLVERVRSVLLETVKQLPSEIKETVEAAETCVRLFPDEKEVENGRDPRALSAFEAAPPPAASTHLILYAANLYAEFGDLDEFDEFVPHIRDCIHEEVVAFLDLSPPESKRLGLLRDDD